ncbi:MAG: pectate lyase [Paenibacillaceae bacterium]|nr:pectate lyase [Paenibacillaceae bacterium]
MKLMEGMLADSRLKFPVPGWGVWGRILAFVIAGVAALLIGSASAHAASFYVAPDGDDSNPGTIDAPFKSIMQAQSFASAGDVVYLRGGTYSDFAIAATDSNYNYVHRMDKSGITYEAYGDEKPVFDFSNVPTNRRVAAFHVPVGTSNVTFRGFEVTGVKAGSQKQSECFRIQGNAHFDRVSAHDTEANGFYFTTQGSGSLINCDAYNNIGPTSASIGNTDGFGFHANAVTVKNCRSWHNSDDGYDSISSPGSIHFENSWAYNMTVGGDSNGFKVGGGTWGNKLPNPVPVHIVKNCLSANNDANGFYANHHLGQAAIWTYNTAFNNKTSNFNMLERTVLEDLHSNIAGYREELHYNIAFQGTDIMNADLSPERESYNSWTMDVTVSEEDFQSLDASQMTLPRKPDGSLPDITFMKLTAGSDLAGLGYGALNQAGVSLDSASLNLTAGATGQLEATVLPLDAAEKTVKFSSSNTGVATVSQAVYSETTGKTSVTVTAVAAGTAVITAETADGAHTAASAVAVTAVPGGSDGEDSDNDDEGSDSGGNGGKGSPNTPAPASAPAAPAPVPTTPVPAPATPAASASITDIANHWANATIAKLVNEGVIAGYPDQTFKPDRSITRAEFVKLLVAAFDLQQKSGKVFSDTAGHWARDYISVANAYGIADGYSDTEFGPDDRITREQMAVMVVKAAKLASAAGEAAFTDKTDLSSWASSGVFTAKNSGIIDGYTDGSFKPKGSATRAEAVTIIVKALAI